jgi:hypothetical protein
MFCEKEAGIEIVPCPNHPGRGERERLLFSIFHAKG